MKKQDMGRNCQQCMHLGNYRCYPVDATDETATCRGQFRFRRSRRRVPSSMRATYTRKPMEGVAL